MNRVGMIFDIQRFSINDGPGIRTTIFMKGCSLRCSWCHNPESISPRKQLNYNKNKCILCGECIKYVEGNGIFIEKEELKVDFNIHNENFNLIKICRNNAYGEYGKEYSVEEVVEIALKDKDYYKESNGGITFSGGEALNQLEFIEAVAKKLKNEGIHIVLDISGFNKIEDLVRSTEFVDLYLLDYKLDNNEEIQKLYLGKKIDFKEVIECLEKYNKPTILRCPIIPEINGNKKHLEEISKISNRYKNLKEVEILPYHNMMKIFKFKEVNKREMYNIPNEEDKRKWLKILKDSNLKNGIMDGKKIK